MCIHLRYTKMTDIFDNTVLCRRCNIKMDKVKVLRDGFVMRTLKCHECSQKIYHPSDVEEHDRFSHLRDKAFKVKLRIIGNSYAVSIPKEIVNFIHEQERIMDDIVRLSFEESGRIALIFGKHLVKSQDIEEDSE